MLNTVSLAESAKKALGNVSDYRLAKELGVTQSTISAWRHRGSVMDDNTAIKAAKIAGIDPCEALLGLMVESHKNDPAGAVWQEVSYRAIGQR